MVLFKKRVKEEEEEMGEKSAPAGLTLLRLNLLPIIAAVAVMLVAGYVAYLQFAIEVSASQRERHQADARALAAQLSGRIAAMGERLARLARVDEGLLAAIQAEDREGLRQREQLLAPFYPDALRLRILLPSEREPDNSVSPPIGYACLDLARQTESGKLPPLELHLFGTEEAHLDLLRPLSREGRVVASLMVSLPPERVKEWLAGLKPGEAYIELQQGEGNLLLGAAGNAAIKQGEPLMDLDIAGSSWRLLYWMGDSIGVAEAQKVGFLATFAVAAALLVLVLFLFGLMLSRRVSRELAAMVDFIIESRRGKRFHSYPVKLVELERTLQALEPVLASPNGRSEISEKAIKGDSGIPDMMFADFGEITVEEEHGEEAAEPATADEGDAGKS